MINIVKKKKFIDNSSQAQICYDVQYFGEDILKADVDDNTKKLIESSINKDCITSDGDKGIIIGFEDSSCFNNYYFIIYCPKTEEIIYEVVNNNNLIKIL